MTNKQFDIALISGGIIFVIVGVLILWDSFARPGVQLIQSGVGGFAIGAGISLTVSGIGGWRNRNNERKL